MWEGSCKAAPTASSPKVLSPPCRQDTPIPNRPWSHLGVDFITDLPVSDGNTCILVIIDRFSKFFHLISLAGLPTALQTAELLFNQVALLWHPRRHRIGQRPTIHLPSLESLLLTPRCDRKPLFWVAPRPSARSRTWDTSCEPSAMAARTLGTSSLAGPSTPRIPYVRARLDSLPSSAYLVSSLPCFHGQGKHQTFPRSTTGSERARESGTLLTISYSRQCADRGWQRTFDDQPVPNTNLGKRSGCPHETSSCACLAGSSVPDSLAPSPFWNRLTQSIINWSHPHTTGFNLPSTYHYSNPSLLLFPQSLARQKSTLSLSSKTKEPSTA